jgi:hypothetical protein
MKIKSLLASLLVGLPGGGLIFMGMLMFNALLGRLVPTSQWTMLGLLCLTALTVGWMARWMRPYHGLGSALAAGLVAAGIILFLWLRATADSPAGPLFGPGGMLAAVAFSTFGGWVQPHVPKRRP